MSQDYIWKGKDATFEEIWNNPVAEEIRETLSKGEWHPNCLICKEREEKFGKSGRQEYNELEGELGTLSYLDYRPSNLCNLKCRMCNGFHSSLLAMEEEKNFKYIFDKGSEKDELPVDWSKLKRIKLLGGEPMIMEETLDVLEKVSEDCELLITTNAYKISPDIEKALLKTKARVRFNLSVDGIGKTYEYIRVGSDWKRVEENILRLRSLGFSMSLNPVGMMWNAFGLNDLFEWCETHGIPQNHLHWVGESWNRLGLLSDEHKEQIAHPKLDPLLKEKLPETLVTKWKEETNRLDLLRGTNIVELDDRFVDYL